MWPQILAGKDVQVIVYVYAIPSNSRDRMREKPGCIKALISMKSTINTVIGFFTTGLHYGHQRAFLPLVDP